MKYPKYEITELTYEQDLYSQKVIDEVLVYAVDKERIAHGIEIEKTRHRENTGKEMTPFQVEKISELYQEIGIARPASIELKTAYGLARLGVPLGVLVDEYLHIRTEVGEQSFIGGLILADRITGMDVKNAFMALIDQD